ncbi:conserved hypothetical protein (plasmid) [Nitrosococcus halophilus Nc 4]|uniref:Uncharacterized protein n=1 Tax=Nitrosococcus halophilus (strain Nc4) TaxID=472759 RepID=D5C5E5_NITHN|nr:hypothetical protein [Nitrosococcus halophilus]ADE16999.1 conserved hypothetical protein [Nitrosococcus halophilus Nc 4]
MPTEQVIEQEEYNAQGWAHQQELEQRRQEEEERAKVLVRELSEAAIRAGCKEWEDLSNGQRLDLAAVLIRAESWKGARFEYVSETKLAESLPLRIAQAMEERENMDRFSNLGRDLVTAALGYAAYAGQEALDQARERLAVRQADLSEEEWLDRRDRARDMATEIRPIS